jgi:hypothetical protein
LTGPWKNKVYKCVDRFFNIHQTMTMTIRQQYPPAGTIGLHEPVGVRVYNWEGGDVPKIPCQEAILGKEGLN